MWHHTVRKISTRQCEVSTVTITLAVTHIRSSQQRNFMEIICNFILKSTDDPHSTYQVWQVTGFKIGKNHKQSKDIWLFVRLTDWSQSMRNASSKTLVIHCKSLISGMFNHNSFLIPEWYNFNVWQFLQFSISWKLQKNVEICHPSNCENIYYASPNMFLGATDKF